jgi:flagellin-like hook-associated protein FlgL
MAERLAADLGADGLGRLVVDPVAADTVSFAEDFAGSPFGFKVQSINANLSGANVSGPAGSPPGMSIQLTGQPQTGQTVSITLGLPDGSSTTITLMAAMSAEPGKFALGATVTDTAENLRTALSANLEAAGQTALAASPAAATEFFASGGNQIGRWFARDGYGAPRCTRTTRTPGTGTIRPAIRARMRWRARQDYHRRLRDAANESASRRCRQSAALVAADFSGGGDAASGQSSEMIRRVRVNLEANTQSVNATTMEMAGAQIMIDQAHDRLTATKSTLAELTDKVEGVDVSETSANLLSLQSRIQASYEATAILYQMNLADYL